MSKKKFSLASQYAYYAILVFMILTIYIASREDFGFKEYEPIISKLYYIGLILFTIIGLIKPKEKTDESAEKVLGKVNQICLNVAILGLILLTLLVGAPMYKEVNLSRDIIGLFMLILLAIITSLKLILFHYFDRKGL